jgi:hypothetical protein
LFLDFSPFKPLSSESNVVAFYEDRKLTGLDSNGQVETFEPGAEVVFRCVDIGKIDHLIVIKNIIIRAK